MELLYFSAPWCGPCRVFGPLLNRVATELGIRLIKVNVDDNPDLAQEYSVYSIPTVVAISVETAEVLGVSVGALKEDELRGWIAEVRP